MSRMNLVPRGRPFRFFATLQEQQRKSILSTVLEMGEHGFHAKTIAKIAGITPSQVYAICKRFGVKLRAYRNGEGKPAEQVILRTSVMKIRKIKSVGRVLSA